MAQPSNPERRVYSTARFENQTNRHRLNGHRLRPRLCNTCEFCDPETIYATTTGSNPKNVQHMLSVCDENGHVYGAVVRCPHYQQASDEKLKALEDAVCKALSTRRPSGATNWWPKPKQ